MKPRILIAGFEAKLWQSHLSDFLSATIDVEIDIALTPNECIWQVKKKNYKLILLDIYFDTKNPIGFELLQRCKNLSPTTKITIFSNRDDYQTMLYCKNLGADYLSKTRNSMYEISELITSCFIDFEKSEREKQFRYKTGIENAKRVGAIFKSEAMKNVFALTSYALENPKTHVLIRGEEGVGKELVARACAEKHLPFKSLNCAGISDNLLQSELFGHEKGSYTGAISRHEGLIAAARGGSLFLDEFGDLSLRAQAALLRAAEYGEIKKVGSTATEFIEFRIIAATNANLEYKIARGNFRQDFLSRFTRLQITIPPLRERPEDIEVIVHHIIATHDKHKNKKFSKDCIHLFEQYSWPGNVRQLQNLVLNILETTNQKMISISDLPNEFLNKFARKETATLGNLSDCHLNPEPTYRQSLTEAIRDYERFIIKKHIASLGCSPTKTSLAASLGIPRTSLRRKLTNLNISIKD